MSSSTLRPYIITNDGEMLWRKDPKHTIASIMWLLLTSRYLFVCQHCDQEFTSNVRRDAADLAYQHFIAKHTTLTDEGLSA